MTRKELIDLVAEAGKTSKVRADNIIEEFLKAIFQSQKTIIKGFGTFEWKTRKARVCKNPITGEKLGDGFIEVDDEPIIVEFGLIYIRLEELNVALQNEREIQS